MKLSDRQIACLKSELKRTGVTKETVQERYHLVDIEKMPEDVYTKVMYALAKTDTAKAA